MDMTSLPKPLLTTQKDCKPVVHSSRPHLQAATTQALKPLKVDNVAFTKSGHFTSVPPYSLTSEGGLITSIHETKVVLRNSTVLPQNA